MYHPFILYLTLCEEHARTWRGMGQMAAGMRGIPHLDIMHREQPNRESRRGNQIKHGYHSIY